MCLSVLSTFYVYYMVSWLGQICCTDMIKIYRAVHEISVLAASASREDSGEFAHIHRLARALAARIHKVWM